MSDDFRPVLAKVAAGHVLSEDEAAAAFDRIMSGEVTPSQMGGFLMALRVRGEAVSEIAGAARTMRAKALAIAAPPGAIDTVGTGGDGSGSFNISTAAALVVAGADVPVAKHGNRNFSSKSGAADILAALGVNLDCDMALVQRAIYEAGICFLMAPRHHSATRHVGPTRVGARHAHHLQSARAAVQSRRREAPARRRVRGGMGRAGGARCSAGSAASMPGWCMATGSTRSPPPARRASPS